MVLSYVAYTRASHVYDIYIWASRNERDFIYINTYVYTYFVYIICFNIYFIYICNTFYSIYIISLYIIYIIYISITYKTFYIVVITHGIVLYSLFIRLSCLFLLYYAMSQFCSVSSCFYFSSLSKCLGDDDGKKEELERSKGRDEAGEKDALAGWCDRAISRSRRRRYSELLRKVVKEDEWDMERGREKKFASAFFARLRNIHLEKETRAFSSRFRSAKTFGNLVTSRANFLFFILWILVSFRFLQNHFCSYFGETSLFKRLLSSKKVYYRKISNKLSNAGNS